MKLLLESMTFSRKKSHQEGGLLINTRGLAKLANILIELLAGFIDVNCSLPHDITIESIVH